jgi:hypothetical protein
VTVVDRLATSVATGAVILRVLPSNDNLADAIPITERGLSFGTFGATTDGPNDSFLCEMDSDIWYCYTPSCMGEATVSLCESTYDTKLAVYHTCRYPTDNSRLIECNDDACGSQSEITFDVVAGNEYLIRVGGKDEAQGNGQLTITCRNKPACCFPDGTCENLWPRTCVDTYGGVSQDLYTTCDMVECPQPEQACCILNGNCEDLHPKDCLDQWGVLKGEGTTCATATCEQTEACCLPDGSCADMLIGFCESLNGSSMGAGSTCATEDCSLASACCMGDGSCSELSPEDCLSQSGIPQGAGTLCSGTTCSQPQACCQGDGACSDVSPEICSNGNGFPQGAGTTCATVECPVLEACCWGLGFYCDDLPVDTCLDSSGIPLGAGTSCADTNCPPLQACCFDDGGCTNLPEATCSEQGGNAQGTGTVCALVHCSELCEGDIDKDLDVDEDDLRSLVDHFGRDDCLYDFISGGLVARYGFEGNANDFTRNRYNGIEHGGVSYGDGYRNQAAFFDGIDDYIELPRMVEESFSVSFWMNTKAVAPSGSDWWAGFGLVDGEVCGSPAGGDWGVALINGGYVITWNASSSVEVNDGLWHSVALTRSMATGLMGLYIDGVFQASTVGPTTPLTGPPWLGVGNNPCDVSHNRRWFSGAIDELTFYDRVLGEQEIGNLGNPCKGDLDGDGDIDGLDLAILIADFGRIDCPH